MRTLVEAIPLVLQARTFVVDLYVDGVCSSGHEAEAGQELAKLHGDSAVSIGSAGEVQSRWASNLVIVFLR